MLFELQKNVNVEREVVPDPNHVLVIVTVSEVKVIRTSPSQTKKKERIEVEIVIGVDMKHHQVDTEIRTPDQSNKNRLRVVADLIAFTTVTVKVIVIIVMSVVAAAVVDIVLGHVRVIDWTSTKRNCLKSLERMPFKCLRTAHYRELKIYRRKRKIN